MTVYFADSSALTRSYLGDELGSADLRRLLLKGEEAVLASQLAAVEVPAALAAASRAGRLDDQRLATLVDRYERDAAELGRVSLMPLDPDPVLARAREIVLEHPIRTLDALHLAVAETAARRLADDDELIFVTRDQRQRAVAEALGLATA